MKNDLHLVAEFLARKLRSQYLPPSVLNGKEPPTLAQRNSLLKVCCQKQLPVIAMGRAVGKVPASLKDKNWRGRALEVFLGGRNGSLAGPDFEDGEMKSTRVVGAPGAWRIEQTLRITTLSHFNSSHLSDYRVTPFYRKLSTFTCVLFDSVRGDIESGRLVGYFQFHIDDDPSFSAEIEEDYRFYLSQALNSARVSSKVKSPNGFLGCRQTAGKAGVVSATSLYITPVKFNELLDFYGVNGA